MPSSPTNSPNPLTPQCRELLQQYEFRINHEYETRPVVEVRHRGSLRWVEIALIPPESNYNTILIQVLIDAAHAMTEMVEEEQPDTNNQH